MSLAWTPQDTKTVSWIAVVCCWRLQRYRLLRRLSDAVMLTRGTNQVAQGMLVLHCQGAQLALQAFMAANFNMLCPT